MAISFECDDDDPMISAINTTPLVDVMLVLLIIFLITVPVAVHSVNVDLPKDVIQATQTRPDTVTIAIDRTGATYWNEETIASPADLGDRLKIVAAQDPQPAIQIRGDQNGRYEFVGKVVSACQRAGIAQIGFITEPAKGG
jgi:biopolymer transport protein ExbD